MKLGPREPGCIIGALCSSCRGLWGRPALTPKKVKAHMLMVPIRNVGCVRSHASPRRFFARPLLSRRCAEQQHENKERASAKDQFWLICTVCSLLRCLSRLFCFSRSFEARSEDAKSRQIALNMVSSGLNLRSWSLGGLESRV